MIMNLHGKRIMLPTMTSWYGSSEDGMNDYRMNYSNQPGMNRPMK